MVRDCHGKPVSLPAYFVFAALTALFAWWSEAVNLDEAAVVAVVSLIGAAAVLFSTAQAQQAMRLILSALTWLRAAVGTRTPIPPCPRSLEPIDSAAYLRIVSVSEPRASNVAG